MLKCAWPLRVTVSLLNDLSLIKYSWLCRHIDDVIIGSRTCKKILLTTNRRSWNTSSISRGLLLVPGRSAWLQMRSPTICAFDAVLADHSRPRAATFSSVSFSGLIDALNNVLLFLFRDGNSLIIVNALQPFSSLNALVKILSSSVKGAIYLQS